MKKINEIRDDYKKLTKEELDIEIAISKIRIARATEHIAMFLEKISDNIESARIY